MTDTEKRCYSYIRFSSPEQTKGDSRRRQTELAEKWAEENGFILDNELTMYDEGMSGFYAAHKKKGALGQFLKRVENGKVAEGSILLVEALDRLSREHVWDALTQFMNIIGAGIDIVTLMDGRHYSKHSDPQKMSTDLIISITLMTQATVDSALKVSRMKNVYAQKHKAAFEHKIPSSPRCPAWLKYDKKNRRFEMNAKRVAIVREIFDWYEKEYGSETIARMLNDRGEGRWTHAVMWHRTRINDILRNRAVLGEFMPHEIKFVDILDDDGEVAGQKRIRKPLYDEPITEYYPRVIEPEQFDKVQLMIDARVEKFVSKKTGKTYKGSKAGGRIGLNRNLFTKLMKCGYCGANMSAIPKTKIKGGYRRGIVCNSGKLNAGCKCRNTVPYEPFEAAFLGFVGELNLESIIKDEESAELKALDKRLVIKKQELKQIDEQIDNVIDTAALTTSEKAKEGFGKKADKLYEEKAIVEDEISVIINDIYKLRIPKDELLDSRDTLLFEVKQLIDKDSPEYKASRHRAKVSISKLVERIDFYVNGTGGQEFVWELNGHVTLEPYMELDKDTPQSLVNLRQAHIDKNTGKEAACALIKLKGGYEYLLRWNSDTKKFKIDMAVTKAGTVIGGKLFYNTPEITDLPNE